MIRMPLSAGAALFFFLASPTLRAHEPATHDYRARVDTLTIPVPDLAPEGLRVRVFVPKR